MGVPGGVRVKCVMSCHCFTLSQSADTTFEYDYDHEGETRVFCPERYELSKSILAHFEYALGRAQSFKVFWDVDKSGGVNNLTVDDRNDGYRYCMYFDLSRHDDETGRYVLLQIRSAYRRDIRLSGRNQVKIGTLIDQKLGIRPMKTRKKKRKK